MYGTRGLGLNCPGDPGCPGNVTCTDPTDANYGIGPCTGVLSSVASQILSLPGVVSSTPTASTSSLTTWLNQNSSAVLIGGGVLLLLVFLMPPGRSRR